MSTPEFIDIHARVVSGLASALDGTGVTGSTPDDLSAPAVVVYDVDGDDDGLTDEALVDVQCFAPTRDEAWALARDCRRAMHALAGSDPSGDGDRLIDSVATLTRPTRRPYDNPAVTRFVATYRVSARAQ